MAATKFRPVIRINTAHFIANPDSDTWEWMLKVAAEIGNPNPNHLLQRMLVAATGDWTTVVDGRVMSDADEPLFFTYRTPGYRLPTGKTVGAAWDAELARKRAISDAFMTILGIDWTDIKVIYMDRPDDNFDVNPEEGGIISEACTLLSPYDKRNVVLP